jgi:NADH dehydrogenase (ubiquinone) 1 alpha subcomplex subunit 2
MFYLSRNFLEKNYVDIKKGNPKFPILVRECSGIFPKMYARYGKKKS